MTTLLGILVAAIIALILGFMMRRRGGMRIAAGITLMLLGVAWAFLTVGYLLWDIQHGVPASGLFYYILMLIPGAFLVAGGVFCVKRRYWKVCFASALVGLVIVIFCMSVAALWLSYFVFVISVGILPTIFVYLSRREWSESQT